MNAHWIYTFEYKSVCTYASSRKALDKVSVSIYHCALFGKLWHMHMEIINQPQALEFLENKYKAQLIYIFIYRDLLNTDTAMIVFVSLLRVQWT